MLMSGVVKLTSGDDSWWNLTALDYHYWTQPLPTVLGWWAHKAPEWFRKFSTFFVLFVESVVPFFIWAPRRVRHVACALLILLQILIALTGNYCFFNLLTIALCLLLIDDGLGPQTLLGRARLRRAVRSGAIAQKSRLDRVSPYRLGQWSPDRRSQRARRHVAAQRHPDFLRVQASG